ncbi:tubulin delta chain-like [Daktulosphaira vitifoliae]|uniref:tubulin delta chain-like n=1 Tax=Daktulosphaira vitifoliae TaxID=58002 RepID=UPI0021AA0318|nr:tubulin delta chain-like [Daktulosphaira vitifoliae]
MSVLTLCFGNCGVHLAQYFYSIIFDDNNNFDSSLSNEYNKEYKNISESIFFEKKSNDFLEPRTILVDLADPKIKTTSINWGFGPNSLAFNFIEGKNNNWSYYYHIKGPEVYEDVSNRLRNELQKLDVTVKYFLIILSSSGGCSGLACFVLENLKKEYAKILFNIVIILPYETKDAIQNYNTLFSVISQAGHSEIKVSFDDINEVCSKQLASIFQPLENQHFTYFMSLVSDTKYKLLKTISSPNYRKEYLSYESTPKWGAIINQTIRSLNEKSCLSLGNKIVSRGIVDNELIKQLKFDKLNDTILFPTNILDDVKFSHVYQNKHFLNTKYLSVLSNSTVNVDSLNSVLKLANRAFLHKAFIHHYSEFNTSREDFKYAFSITDEIIKDYYKLK